MRPPAGPWSRAEGVREGRRLLVEAELHASGRDRVQVNRQPLRRSRDLLGAFASLSSAPDDLELVKGGPQGRREYLDDLLVALHPRHDGTITEVDRVLKQRNALLKSAGAPAGAGRSLPPDVVSTLDVWDAKLAAAGEELAGAREALATSLEPLAADVPTAGWPLAVAHRGRATVALRLPAQLGRRPARRPGAGPGRDDLRRGVTTVGPHRDELVLEVGGMPARTHASQGEQRSLALALRLAGHQLGDRAGRAAPRCSSSTTCSPSWTRAARRGAAGVPAGGAGDRDHRRPSCPPAADVAARSASRTGSCSS